MIFAFTLATLIYGLIFLTLTFGDKIAPRSLLIALIILISTDLILLSTLAKLHYTG